MSYTRINHARLHRYHVDPRFNLPYTSRIFCPKNCNIFSVSSVFKRNPGKINDESVSIQGCHTDEFQRKRKRRIIVHGLGHSLWSAKNRLPAQAGQIISSNVQYFRISRRLCSDCSAVVDVFSLLLSEGADVFWRFLEKNKLDSRYVVCEMLQSLGCKVWLKRKEKRNCTIKSEKFKVPFCKYHDRDDRHRSAFDRKS